MENLKNIKIRIQSIKEEIVKRQDELAVISELSAESVQFQYKIGSLIDVETDTITVTPIIRYLHDNSEIFKASAEFVFSIHSLSSIVDIDLENKKINMNANLFPTLVSTAYSTLRGIVFVHTKDTLLDGFPLPLIDIDTLVTNNAVTVKQ